MRVRGDAAAHHVRGFDDRVKLGICELLRHAGGGVGEHAAGRGDLDDVRAGLRFELRYCFSTPAARRIARSEERSPKAAAQ